MPIVEHRKVRIIKQLATAGISNNTAEEYRKKFVAEAMKDYEQESRSVNYCLRLQNRIRHETE